MADRSGAPAAPDSPELFVNPWWVAGAGLIAAAGLRALGRHRWRAGVALGMLGAAGLGYLALVEPPRPVLERVTLRPAGWPAALAGLRIGQISDLHLGHHYAEANVAWAIAAMRRERPDMIVLTGDFIAFADAIPTLGARLAGLSAPLGVYAVLGNHDGGAEARDVITALGHAGVVVLRNQSRWINVATSGFWLLGLDDIWHGRHDVAAMLDGVSPTGCRVLLAHAPDVVELAARHQIAVQLSGHTHGGQIRLPWIGPFSLPRHGTRYPIGEYRVGPTTLYVSRGVAGAPLRLGCPPEATVITLAGGA
jgi:predicted MPP superfamily phosphohydrolase